MAGGVLDELDAYFTGEIAEKAVGSGADDQAATDAGEGQPDAEAPAATAGD